MRNDQMQRVRAIQLSMDESARPGFDDEDIQHLHNLVSVTVRFYDYLTSAPSPDDPFREMNYAIDPIFFNLDSFRVVMHSYFILVGSTASTINWNAITLTSLKDEFVSVYHAFVAQTNFETKCRLLLDLFKLQIVFAGAFYDCLPPR